MENYAAASGPSVPPSPSVCNQLPLPEGSYGRKHTVCGGKQVGDIGTIKIGAPVTPNLRARGVFEQLGLHNAT